MPNVILNFEITQTGNAAVVDALAATGKVEQTVADNTKKANAALQEQQKQLSGATTGAKQLAIATGDVAKAIAGGAFAGINKAIDSLSSKTLNSSQKFSELYKSVNEARSALAKLDPASADFGTLSREIEAAEKALTNFQGEAASGRARLRQYRDTLLQLEEQGLENTQVFQDLAAAAGELTDAVEDTQARLRVLGSDTFGFDVALDAAQGLAGGFAAVQGAAALFGAESENLQKALLKVNAAMSVLQGLQAIQNLLQAQSALYLGAQIALQKLALLQTNLQAAAESRFIIVRYAAAVAQRVLNAVMAANPAGVVLVAIGALAALLVVLTSNTDDAAEAQKKLNAELAQSIKLNEQAAKVAEQTSNVQLATLQRNRVSADALRAAEAQALRDQVTIAKDSYDKANKVLEAYGKDVKKLSSEQNAQRLETLKMQQDARQKYFDLENQLQVKRIQNQKEAEDDSLKSATAAAEARISQVKKDSAAETAARINAIRVGQVEQLKAEGITEGEREKIISDNARAISDIQEQALQRNLSNRIASLQAASAREKDTYVKLNKDIEIILLQSQADSVGKSADQAKLIEAKRDADILSLRKAHYAELTLLDKAHNERLTAADVTKIKEDISRTQDALEVKRQKNEDHFKYLLELYEKDKLAQIAAIDATLTVVSSLSNTLTTIQQNQVEAQSIKLKEQLDEQTKNLKNQLDNKLITQSEYDKAVLVSQEKYDRAIRKLQHDQAIRERDAAIFQAGISLAQSILKVISDKAVPVYLQPLYIALNTAAALAQIAAIRSKPIPAYAEGTDNAVGGKSLVGEAGAELVYNNGRWSVATKAMIMDLQKGAKVIPALETSQILQAYSMPMPQLPKGSDTVNNSGPAIDYNKLGKVIGKEIGKIPFSATDISEKGISHITSSIAKRQAFLKSRYRSI